MLLTAVLVPLMIAGCASAAPVSSPATATPVESAKPTPAPTIARVTILADSITVTDSSGNIVDSIDFFTAPAEIVRVLTDAFGVAPESTHHEPCQCDRQFNNEHNWEGLRLGERSTSSLPSEQPGEPPYDTVAYIKVTAASVHGIAIDTVDGVMVGDEATSIDSSDPGVTEPNYGAPNEPDLIRYSLGKIALPDNEKLGTNLSFSVSVYSNSRDGLVTSFVAPQKNFGL